MGESPRRVKLQTKPGKNSWQHNHGMYKFSSHREYDAMKSSGNETILIIEDEEMLLQLEKTIFERLGYTIYAAENGIEGCKIFYQHYNLIDLVILDMNMPKMDGAETLKRIMLKNDAVKVILISGNDMPQKLLDEFVSEGATAFIQKPFDIPQLTELVRRILDE